MARSAQKGHRLFRNNSIWSFNFSFCVTVKLAPRRLDLMFFELFKKIFTFFFFYSITDDNLFNYAACICLPPLSPQPPLCLQTSSPFLQASWECQRRGGPESWRCVRGPAQCRAAAGRNELTGSADQLQGNTEREARVVDFYAVPFRNP